MTTNEKSRVDVIGVPVDCVTMSDSVRFVDQMIIDKRRGTVLAVNPEKVMRAQEDPALLSSLTGASLLIPDGIGVVFAARMQGEQSIERVPGSELMPEVCALAASKGYGVFLYGAAPEVNHEAGQELVRMYPELRIVGQQHGYLDDGEMPGLIERINESGADILFVALGSPKQEIWMHRYLPELDVKVCQGVGGTFDVIAGRVRRAPMLFRRIHLEWLYRLLKQPSRIFRQTAVPRFAYEVMRQKLAGDGPYGITKEMDRH